MNAPRTLRRFSQHERLAASARHFGTAIVFAAFMTIAIVFVLVDHLK